VCPLSLNRVSLGVKCFPGHPMALPVLGFVWRAWFQVNILATSMIFIWRGRIRAALSVGLRTKFAVSACKVGKPWDIRARFLLIFRFAFRRGEGNGSGKKIFGFGLQKAKVG